MSESASYSVALGTQADFLDLAALDRAIWHSYPNGENIPDGEHTWGLWCRTALSAIARNAQGMCIGGAVAFPTLGALSGQQRLVLHKVFVADGERGRGVGTALTEAICDQVDKLQAECFITVNPENKRAVACYTRMGFGSVGGGSTELVKGYYRETEDRLVLSRVPRAS